MSGDFRIDELLYFIRERHNVYIRKNVGARKPWSEDRIFQQYRFCNVYRELDKVTRWIATRWRQPHHGDPNLWFALAVARLINWPDTLEELGYPVPWRAERFKTILARRRDRGEKVYTGAYMVRADAVVSGYKSDYHADHVLSPMWKRRETVTRCIEECGSLATVHSVLTQFRDMGSFMAAQVIADLKYVAPLRAARDWQTWAAPGPGSLRGLNRVMNRDRDSKWIEEEWYGCLLKLREEINHHLRQKPIMPALHAQDLQNCLCEFDKYERVRLGEGRPRATYPGAA